MTEAAAGFVIFRRVRSEIQYLLLQASYGTHHWSPPKGHVDPEEDDKQTALREVEEESGIKKDNLHVLPGFEKELNYIADNKPKKVVYYLAELIDPNQKIILSDEHQDFKWLPLEAACKVVQFTESQDLLRASEEFLKSQH